MKITNHIQQNIRTLFVIMSVLIMAWGNVNEVKGQSITPDGINPSAYAVLENFLPTNMRSIIYDSNKKATCDKLLISLQLPSSAFGFEGGVPYILVFEPNKDLKYNSTPGSENWFVLLQRFKLTEQSIVSSGALNDAAGQVIYYSANFADMSAFGLPYITSYGILPAESDELISPHLPDDYLTTFYNSSKKAIMDNIFVATKFDGTEVNQIQSEYGVSVTANQSYMLPFCKVICSDGNDYYALTNIASTASTNFTLDNINNKKFYFTGTVDEAYAGAGITSEGFFFIKGTEVLEHVVQNLPKSANGSANQKGAKAIL